MSEKIQVILFDLGGVLVELTGVPTMLNWANGLMTPDQLWEKWLSSPTVRAYETGQISSNSFAEKLVTEMSLPVSPDEFIEEFTYWPKGLFPGVLELMERISSEYTVAALSNTNPLHWSRFVDEMDLESIFDHCFASHLMGMLKPDTEVFAHVMDSLQCEPASILFIDDNRLNVNAAKALGLVAEEAKGIRATEQVFVNYGIIR